MARDSFRSFVPPEQIESIYGNVEVAKELTRLSNLQSQVSDELSAMQAKVRESYDGDEKDLLLDSMDRLRELNRMISDEMRKISRLYPAKKQG